MHNVKRDEYKARLREDATAKKLATKANQWHVLSGELIKRRKEAKNNDANMEPKVKVKNIMETLKLNDKLLSVNPDPIYLWNLRREFLLDLIKMKQINASDFIKQEQILTQTALQRNPKAYGTWLHRKWSLRKFIEMVFSLGRDSEKEEITQGLLSTCIQVFKGELMLCSEFLTLDERNFHCWNYRRYIVSTLAILTCVERSNITNDIHCVIDGEWKFLNLEDNHSKETPVIGPQLTNARSTSNSLQSLCYKNGKEVFQILQKEWEFTSEKVYQNFSNGSAFHYRSKLLPLISYYNNSEELISADLTQKKTRSDWVQEELELIRNAIFTEPDDQTSWWYFRFIIAWANPLTASVDESESTSKDEKEDLLEQYMQMLYEEWTSIQELVETEDGQCKWGILGLYMIATTFNELQMSGVDGANEYEGESWLELSTSYLDDLIELDPDRKHRYEKMKDILSG